MAHFAHLTNGVVDQVIVIERSVLEQTGGWPVNGVFRPMSEFVQTSFNVTAGEYMRGDTLQEKDSLKLSGTDEDRLARSRKNYAGIGYTYDEKLDAFIPPKPQDAGGKSAVLNADKGTWEFPNK